MPRALRLPAATGSRKISARGRFPDRRFHGRVEQVGQRRTSATVTRTPTTSPSAVLFQLVGRSLFPIVALALISGTLLWGPWVSLVLTIIWWRIVTWSA